MSPKRVVLIGCGAFAAQAHLPALRKAVGRRIELIAIVDLAVARAEVEARAAAAGFPGARFIGLEGIVPDGLATERHLDLLTSALGAVDAVIVSSSGISHKPYVEWALRHHLAVLVDKPLTVRPDCSHDASAARGLVEDFHELVSLGEDIEPFTLAAQRRYQPGYRRIAGLLRKKYLETGQPVTFIQCLTNDGLWHHPEDYAVESTYHPERSGGGKLLHTGYHVLDVLPWLMRHCQGRRPAKDAVRRIRSAEVSCSMFRPADSLAVSGVDTPCGDLRRLGEVNAGIQIALRDGGGGMVAILQIAALHEGLSAKPDVFGWSRADRVAAANRYRTKQEIMTIVQGPAATIWMRRIAKLRPSSGARFGERNHLEVIQACAPRGRDRVPTIERYAARYQARDDAPTAEFLGALGRPAAKRESLSPVRDHSIAIKFLAAAYESAATGRAVTVAFEAEEWGAPPLSAAAERGRVGRVVEWQDVAAYS